MGIGSSVDGRWMLGAEAYPRLHEESRLEAVRLTGSIALQGSVELTPLADEEGEIRLKSAKTLQSSLIGTRNGIEEDEKLVDMNIATEVAERLFAAGHETEIELEVDDDNELTQNGIKLTDVSMNTLRYTGYDGIMRDRSKAELHNGVFFNALHANGILEDNVAVVFSHTPTDEKVKDEYNFFENDALSIQLIMKSGPNNYTIQTAFVAGKTSIDAERHDLDAVKMIALENGVDIMDDDTESVLSRVMILPKNVTVTDIVQQYDTAAGGTFYGEAKQQQDYQTYSKECKKREFASITAKIKQKLLQEAPNYEFPSDAISRLDYWSRKYCLEEALKDDTIDTLAFGVVASEHLQEARVQYAQGNMFEANRSFNFAKQTDASGSCPFKKGASKDGGTDDPLTGEAFFDGIDDEEVGGERKMTCPFCKESTTGDPCASSITCKNCSASTTCSESENERRAEKYKLQKIRKQQEDRIKSIVKKSKEVKNEQFVLAA